MHRIADLARALLRRAVALRRSPPPQNDGRLRARLAVTQLEDRTTPTASVSATVLSNAAENGTGGVIRLTVTGADPFDTLYVAFSLGGTADEGDDYTVTDGMSPVAIETDGSGGGWFNVTLTALADTVADPDETVVLTVQSGTGYTAAGDPAELTITDTPVITMAPVNEFEGGTGQVVFTRAGGDLTGTLTVEYTLSEEGTATSGVDFTAPGGSVTFLANEDTAVVTITLAHDTEYDPDETIALLIEPTSTYVLADLAVSAMATVVIVDDAAGTFTTSNSAQGVFWYDIPLGDVDPDAATQSVSLTNFVLIFGGQTFTTSNTTFSTTPTADLQYGTVVNIRFALTFPNGPVAGYESLSVDGGVATAVDATTQQPENVAVAATDPAMLVLDFSTATIDPNGSDDWVINAIIQPNTPVAMGTLTLPGGNSGGTQTGWRDLVRDHINTNSAGKLVAKADPDDDKRLIITAAAGPQLKSLDFANNTGGTLPAGPKLHFRDPGGAPAAPTFTYRQNNQ